MDDKRKVDADLYEFLKANETHLYRVGGEVTAVVLVDFCNLEEFVNIVGEHHFDEEGMIVNMKHKYLGIELNGIFESDGELLSSYKNCFDEWDEYKYDILREEAKYGS